MVLILGCKHLKSAAVSSQFCQFFYCHVTNYVCMWISCYFVYLIMKRKLPVEEELLLTHFTGGETEAQSGDRDICSA